jgi:PIN domain nuclease of toxin-antitoxin system
MNCLLDTHILIWAATSPEKLSKKNIQILLASEINVFVSTITFWEIALKYAIGKLDLKILTPEDFPKASLDMGFESLPVSVEDASTFYRLNFTDHRDPFDRMLAWQAIRHDLTLMTQDPAFQDYLPLGLQILK